MANPDIPKREGYLKHPEWLNSDIKALGKKGSTLGRLATEGMICLQSTSYQQVINITSE